MRFIEQTLTSMEVAEMVEKAHKDLMRDIRRYTKQFNEGNLAPVDFWVESNYADSKGETRPCYNIYKKGCEFIAHKLTGTKGTVFTAKYINRFHEMELMIRHGSVARSSALPEKATVPAPLRPDWYTKNKRKLRRVCDKMDISHRELYHEILKALGKTYDINAAREIYKRDRGYYPEYAIDIVGYFPELAVDADRILNMLQ